MRFIKELVNKIKNLWNVYGGIALSSLIALVTKWNKDKMDMWASYLLLTLTCISLFTFFKVVVFKSKKGFPDSVALASSKQAKHLKTAVDPLSAGEELGTIILTTINGGVKVKNKFLKVLKVIWGNKFTALSLLLNLVYTGFSQYLLYSDELKSIPFFAENRLLCIIVATSVSAIWLILELVKDIKNLGFESLTTLNNKWAERKAEKEARLSKEQREVVKQTIGGFANKIKLIENAIKDKEEALKPFKATIDAYNTLRELQIPISVEQDNEYSKAVAESRTLNSEKEALETKKLQLENEVAVLRAKL